MTPEELEEIKEIEYSRGRIHGFDQGYKRGFEDAGKRLGPPIMARDCDKEPGQVAWEGYNSDPGYAYGTWEDVPSSARSCWVGLEQAVKKWLTRDIPNKVTE